MPDPAVSHRLRRLALPAVAFAYWTLIELWGLGLNALNGLQPAPGLLPGQALGVAGAALISVVAGIAVSASRPWRLTVRIALAAVLALGGAGAYALWMIALGGVLPVARPPGAQGLAHFAWETLFFLIPFALWTASLMALDQVRLARERDARLNRALVAARDAEVRALHYQVNPHFLFNALNSLSTLILDGRAKEADQMVHRLAALFRSNLSLDPLTDIRLEDEIARQRLYLSLEEIRYGDRLTITVGLAAGLQDALVPSLILQPLVENAVKHGVHEPGRITTIAITASASGDVLDLTVQDDGPGASLAAGAGVGLENVRRRLAARFGDAAELRCGPAPGGGYAASVRLPLAMA